MNDGIRMKLSVGSAEVEVSATRDTVSELAVLAHPFIEVAPLDNAGAGRPAVIVRETAPKEPGWRRLALPSEYEPDRVLWVDDVGQRIAVVSEPSPWRTQQLLRSVRHLLRWQAFAKGDLFLHGGLVKVGGVGIAFLGGKRSGKTSSVLSMILHGGADFVSNDDVAITDTDTGLVGYGSPRTVNVRTDSLLALAASAPVAAGFLSGSSHPANGYRGRHHTVDSIRSDSGTTLPGSIWVRCAELAHVTGCGLAAHSRIDSVVFPQFGASQDAPRITLMDRDSAIRSLMENVERQASKYDPFLADWFPDTDRLRRERLIERLLEEASFYRLSQNMHRLDEATSLMLDALTDRVVDRRPGDRSRAVSE
ncbi:hypothetical protein HDA32_005559 [Spinactinospora alkalitolerans]|uniref:HPr kinase/phosphorylase C-terminal domain-containing protein n=1 Tax=Spinactinospora alkalitolerans TaxID=687207 RepID=A0A852U2K8_9ACTN|nr:hypothetical protein [Spinactinospora alkalitolerans]NYE50439.1 hypothetical protein [Spinactinospora alkalitolerans]